MDQEKEGLPRAWGEAVGLTAPQTGSQEVYQEKPSFLKKIKQAFVFFIILVVVFGGGFLLWQKFRTRLPGGQQEVNLTYWGLWEPEEVMRGIILDWEKANPRIKITYQYHSPQEYRERLQSAFARGEGPDLFRFHLTWTPMLKNDLATLPATIMSAAEFESSFYPVASRHLRSGTSFLGLPLMYDGLVLFYNEDLFQAAGKTPPQTWDALRQTAVDLTVRNEAGQIQVAGVALGTTSNVDHWSDILGLMMLQNGADLSNPTGSLAEDALKFYTLFNTTDRVWDATLPNSTLAFAQGKAAMYFGPSWRIFDLQSLNPSLRFQVLPVPQLPETNVAWANFWVEGVAQKSNHQEAAWQFLQYLSSEAVLEKLFQAEANLRLFGEIYPRTNMASKLKSDPLLSAFVDEAPRAQTWYLCSSTFDNGLNDRMTKYFEDAVNAVNAGQAPEKVLGTTAQGVAQTLSQYSLGSYTAR